MPRRGPGRGLTRPDRKPLTFSMVAGWQRPYEYQLQSPSAGETDTCTQRAHAPHSAAHSSTAASQLTLPASLSPHEPSEPRSESPGSLFAVSPHEPLRTLAHQRRVRARVSLARDAAAPVSSSATAGSPQRARACVTRTALAGRGSGARLASRHARPHGGRRVRRRRRRPERSQRDARRRGAARPSCRHPCALGSRPTA